MQRDASNGAAVYGFVGSSPVDGNDAVTVSVDGKDGSGTSVSYSVQATVHAWTGGKDIHPNTPDPPAHGDKVWRAELHPAKAGGSYTITATGMGANNTAVLQRVTYGGVLETYFATASYILYVQAISSSVLGRGKF